MGFLMWRKPEGREPKKVQSNEMAEMDGRQQLHLRYERQSKL